MDLSVAWIIYISRNHCSWGLAVQFFCKAGIIYFELERTLDAIWYIH